MRQLRLRLPLRALLPLALAAFLGACSSDSTGPEEGQEFTAMVVIGASLDDTGNACALRPASCLPAPYFGGRWSNGPLWVELLADELGVRATPSATGGTNFAIGGARTGPVAGAPQTVPNMLQQVDLFLAGASVGDRADVLFVVNAGSAGNDFTDGLLLSPVDPGAPGRVVAGAVTSTREIVTRLHTAGARHVLVVNAPDIGATPLVRAFGPASAGAGTVMTIQFNAALAVELQNLRRSLAGIRIYEVDLARLGAEMIANPAGFGLTNATLPCVNTLVTPPTVCTTPNAYLFWDPFHPTATVGRFLSERALAALER